MRLGRKDKTIEAEVQGAEGVNNKEVSGDPETSIGDVKTTLGLDPKWSAIRSKTKEMLADDFTIGNLDNGEKVEFSAPSGLGHL